MKYPSVYLMGERAHGEILSIAFAGKGQHQDAGGKIVHAAPNTTSNIFAKSISKDGGRSSYRGLLEVAKGAHGSKSKVVCDALLLDEDSRSDTYPTIRIGEDDVDVGHEATVSKVGEEQLFYLMSHGHQRGGGRQAHRQRLHRADRQGAADGVRGRDEPPDRAADGGLDWLRSPPLRDFRLKALDHFLARPMPTWGSPMLAEVDFDNIHYFVRASERSERSWDDVPEDVKKTFDRLGIPEAERKFLSGVGAQYESEVVYHQVREDLEKQGVIFMDMDSALREHEDLVREYFATIIPPNDNKLAALNSAVWSGGSFVYVPPGVHVEMPLQAYFRINTENMGQFERTLIIADEGSYVHYVEGCTAPTWTSDSLHSAVVELIAKPGARIRYTTVQNWSQQRLQPRHQARVAETDATVEWVDCNLGSKLTMKYPSRLPDGRARPRRDPLDRLRRQRPAPGRGRQDRPRRAEHDVEHLRQVDLQGRRALARYRGLLEVAKGAHGSKSKVVCDALLLDEDSALGHLPDDPHRRGRRRRRPRGHRLEGRRGAALLPHVATGIPEEEAGKLIVNGFIEPIVKELPMEYAVEMNRLIELQMEGSIG